MIEMSTPASPTAVGFLVTNNVKRGALESCCDERPVVLKTYEVLETIPAVKRRRERKEITLTIGSTALMTPSTPIVSGS